MVSSCLFVAIDVSGELPLEGVEAVRDHVAPDPFFNFATTLGNDAAELEEENLKLKREFYPQSPNFHVCPSMAWQGYSKFLLWASKSAI